ncbi:hypothetical protein TWF281_002905 [Arthrobotrys megalospora]
MPYVVRAPHKYESNVRLKALRSVAYNHTASVWSMCESKQQLELLKTILLTFPNIRTISFENTLQEGLSCFELSLLYPSLGFMPGKKGMASFRKAALDWMAVHNRYEPDWIWQDVLKSVTTAGLTNIKTLGFNNHLEEPGIRISSFSLPSEQLLKFKSGFPNLRRLDLYLNFDQSYNDPCTGFCQWLESIGSQLEELFLSNTGDMFRLRENRVLMLPTSTGLPRLKRLEMVYMTLTVDNFTNFLNHSRDALDTLLLPRCWLYGSSTSRPNTFMLLKYVAEALHSLRHFGSQIPYGDLSYDISYDYDPPSMFLEVNGDWASADTCEARLTRTDGAVAVLNDIASKLQENLELDDKDRADLFWKSILAQDFVTEESEELSDLVFSSEYGRTMSHPNRLPVPIHSTNRVRNILRSAYRQTT